MATTTVQGQPKISLQYKRGIGIEKTALLASANYCEGCPRFWPATGTEREIDAFYGHCRCPMGEDAAEAWRIITLTARVAECYWHTRRQWPKHTNTELINMPECCVLDKTGQPGDG